MKTLNFETASALFALDERLGDLVWKPRPGCARNDRAGSIAGSVRPDGYRNVQVFGKRYLAHRIVWLITHGDWPASQVDHIDRCRSNNRPENLRAATPGQNSQNTKRSKRNTSGCKGVYPHHGGFEARITRSGEVHYLGFHKSFGSAATARAEAQHVLFTHPGAL